MSMNTVLRQVLERVRTFDCNLGAIPNEDLAKTIRSRDFYGSPLNDVELVSPYPTLPLDPDPRWDGGPLQPHEGGSLATSHRADQTVYGREPVRYPPHVAAESPDDGVSSLDLLSTWPLPSLNDGEGPPTPVVIFLEILRCIAAPLTDTDVARHDRGVLSPGKLQRGYFTQVIKGFNGPLVLQDNEPMNRGTTSPLPGGEHLQRRMFRETFLAVYAHVLLRHIAARLPSFIVTVINAADDRKRGDLFRGVLSPAPTPEWQKAVNAAFHCVRRPSFRKLYLSPTHFVNGIDGLREISINNQGKYRLEPADRTIFLPRTLAAILHLCIERTGTDGALYSYGSEKMHTILDDADRLDIVDDLLKPERWIEFNFPANDPQHDLGPSVHLATWASLCVVLEALAAGVLSINLDVPSGAPSMNT